MIERGVIDNRARAKQLRDFSGLRYGNITPTDIDALIEYKNMAYILIETKFGNAEMPSGQMIALERLCDDLQKSKRAILIISRHNYPTEKDIDLSATVVEKYRYHNRWIMAKDYTKELWTVKRLVDWFINKQEQT